MCERTVTQLAHRKSGFANSSLPPVDPFEVDEYFPSPRSHAEEHQGYQVITSRNQPHQTQSRSAGHGNVKSNPKARGRGDRQNEAHRLDIEAAEHSAADEQRKTGRHPAARAGQAGAVEKLAALKSKPCMSADAGRAWRKHRRDDQDHGARQRDNRSAGARSCIQRGHRISR